MRLGFFLLLSPTDLSFIQLGREQPTISMDSTGKIVWAKHNEVQQAVLGKVGMSMLPQLSCLNTSLMRRSDEEVKDGEPVPLSPKDIGTCEIYPQTLAHNPNGRFGPVI